MKWAQLTTKQPENTTDDGSRGACVETIHSHKKGSLRTSDIFHIVLCLANCDADVANSCKQTAAYLCVLLFGSAERKTNHINQYISNPVISRLELRQVVPGIPPHPTPPYRHFRLGRPTLGQFLFKGERLWGGVVLSTLYPSFSDDLNS